VVLLALHPRTCGAALLVLVLLLVLLVLLLYPMA
jgi:uncharacterized protein YqhQ